MKNNFIIKAIMPLAAVLMIAVQIQAQSVVSYRYWFDGQIGSATTVSVTATANEQLTASLPTSALSIGYHTITTQFADANGIYSSPETKSFMRSGFELAAYDYWFDNDIAAHSMVTITNTQDENLAAAITPYNLDTGVHLFTIRFRDTQGNWSVPQQDTIRTTKYISGINELSTVKNVSLYPNPTQGNALLTFEGYGSEVLTMSVTDAAGHTISSQQVQNATSTQQYQVNTADLSAGIYFVRLSSGQGSSTRMLVLQ